MSGNYCPGGAARPTPCPGIDVSLIRSHRTFLSQAERTAQPPSSVCPRAQVLAASAVGALQAVPLKLQHRVQSGECGASVCVRDVLQAFWFNKWTVFSAVLRGLPSGAAYFYQFFELAVHAGLLRQRCRANIGAVRRSLFGRVLLPCRFKQQRSATMSDWQLLLSRLSCSNAVSRWTFRFTSFAVDANLFRPLPSRVCLLLLF